MIWGVFESEDAPCVAYFMATFYPLDGEGGVKSFATQQKVDFPILSDEDQSAAAAFGILPRAGSRRVPTTCAVHIDKEGRIAAIQKPAQPLTAEDILA